ncbi:MFS transporter [Solihabitans fulvus]|uniref:MFS transporter n=2 Tax=Solihabitans fulvus TaxID=1892852 RepID=A0A5B2XJV5_9PSEU|nr:MFS transporter [Solihabitans fulvus]
MLPVILSASFMAAFDFSVVNVAAPSLQTTLHAGSAALELVVGGYAFTYASGMVTGGKLGDLFGHRTLFLLGMAGFTLASLLCGLAGTPGQLVGARLLQGLTASAMVPQVMALITATFPPGERLRALSWFGVTIGLGSTAGQVLGGLLLDADVLGLGWRAIFLINLPVGLVALTFAARWLPRGRAASRPRLDPVGVVGVSGSLALALVPLALGREAGWPAWTWLAMAASVPALVGTLAWERRIARRGGEPLLDLALFRAGSFRTGLAVNVAFMASFSSLMFTVTLLLQAGLGASPLHAGLTFAPLAVGSALSSILGRGLIARHGRRVMTFGSALTGVGVLGLAVELRVLGADLTPPWLLLPLGLAGIGSGLTLPSVLGVALSGVRPAKAGAASGVLTTTQQFAGATGVAVLGALFFGALGTHPGRADFTAAAQLTLWIDVALVAVTTVLITLLPRAATTQPLVSQPNRQPTAA